MPHASHVFHHYYIVLLYDILCLASLKSEDELWMPLSFIYHRTQISSLRKVCDAFPSYSLTEQTCLLINLKLLGVSSELALQGIKGFEVTNLVFKFAPLYTSFMTLKLSLSAAKREL